MNRSRAMGAIGLLTSLSLIFAAAGSVAQAKAAAKSHIGPMMTYVVSPNGPMVDDFSPWSPANAAVGDLFTEVYEPLFYFNILTGQQIPKLATSYSFTNGHKTLTINLRKGVKWSDGQPFTSADVVYTLHMLATTPAIDQNGLGSMIASVKADGMYKAVVNLKAASNEAWYYIGEVTPIVPAHIWSKQKNPATFVDANPVTTGPFVLQSITKSAITLKRNPHYWDAPLPYASGIQMPLYLDNNTAALAMAEGHFDAATNFVPHIQQALIRRDPVHYHYWFPNTSAQVLVPNDAVYPLSLPAFRRALFYAMNRPQIVQLGEMGYEPVGNILAMSTDGANQPFISKSVLNQYPEIYSVAKARALLKQSGFHWNSAAQLVDPHGHVVTLTIQVPSGMTDIIADMGIVAHEYQSLGINTQVKTPSWSTELGSLANGSFQLATNWVDSQTPYLGYNALLNSQFSAPVGKLAVSNTERWTNPEVQKLLTEYPTVFNVAQQKQILTKIEKIFAQNLPVIPYGGGVAWYEYNSTNYVGWPSSQHPWAAWNSPIDAMYIFAQVKPAH